MSFRFIVNPGDFLDVIITDRLHQVKPGSRFYRCSKVKEHFLWEEFRDGRWESTNRGNLPIKVLEAGERGWPK